MTQSNKTDVQAESAPFVDFVPSPCKSLCVFSRVTDKCIGCDRTVAEIQGWYEMTMEEKRVIYERVKNYRPPN